VEELIPCIKNSEYAESALENLLTRENSRALGRQAGNVEVLTVWSDPIADMLTRIRNANLVFKDQLDVPASNLKKSIADILAKEGFIKGYTYIEDGKQGILRIQMKYKGSRRNKERVIHGIVRVSKSGRRIYVGQNRIPRVKNGLGIAILSTSRGVITDKEATELGVGGEVIAYVW